MERQPCQGRLLPLQSGAPPPLLPFLRKHIPQQEAGQLWEGLSALLHNNCAAWGGFRASVFPSVAWEHRGAGGHQELPTYLTEEGPRVLAWNLAQHLPEPPSPAQGPQVQACRQAQHNLGSSDSPGKMKMKKELRPPMMPITSPRLGRASAMASVAVTHRTVSGMRTHGPEGSASTRRPHVPQQLLVQKSCITDLEAQGSQHTDQPSSCAREPRARSQGPLSVHRGEWHPRARTHLPRKSTMG